MTKTSALPETRERKARCRFDMFVRFMPGQRTKDTFCYRGDYPNVTEPPRMLSSLLRFFIKQHTNWKVVELYDNTLPKNNPNRIVLKWSAGILEVNRLRDYEIMLQDFPIPEWLK